MGEQVSELRLREIENMAGKALAVANGNEKELGHMRERLQNLENAHGNMSKIIAGVQESVSEIKSSTAVTQANISHITKAIDVISTNIKDYGEKLQSFQSFKSEMLSSNRVNMFWFSFAMTVGIPILTVIVQVVLTK